MRVARPQSKGRDEIRVHPLRRGRPQCSTGRFGKGAYREDAPVRSMRILLRSAAFGVVGTIALGVLAFALAPFFDAVGMYIAPFGL